MKNITIENITEYIRQEKKRLVEKGGIKMLDEQRFYWNKREWEVLKQFCASLNCKVKQGITFMGAKHYKLKV